MTRAKTIWWEYLVGRLNDLSRIASAFTKCRLGHILSYQLYIDPDGDTMTCDGSYRASIISDLYVNLTSCDGSYLVSIISDPYLTPQPVMDPIESALSLIPTWPHSLWWILSNQHYLWSLRDPTAYDGSYRTSIISDPYVTPQPVMDPIESALSLIPTWLHSLWWILSNQHYLWSLRDPTACDGSYRTSTISDPYVTPQPVMDPI